MFILGIELWTAPRNASVDQFYKAKCEKIWKICNILLYRTKQNFSIVDIIKA